MPRLCSYLCIALMTLSVVGCKKKPTKPDPAKMRICKQMSEAGKQDPERDCKKCCKNAGAFSHTWSQSGCNCN